MTGVALVAAAALPASASAATVSVSEGKLVLAAAAGETNKAAIESGSGGLVVRDGGAPLTAGPGCQKAADGSVTCTEPAQAIDAKLGDGDDSLASSSGLPLEAEGEAGADTIGGGPGDDVIRGGDGDDHLTGNGGNDVLIGAGAGDTLSGGDGADSVQGNDGDDSLDGDADNDTIVGGDGNDSMTGGDGNDRLEAGKGKDSIDGGAGDDVLLTAEGEFRGTAERRVRCGPGKDVLTAGPRDPFVSDCERADGASLRLRKGGLIPLRLVCSAACSGKVRVRDPRGRTLASARIKQAAGVVKIVNVRLSAAQVARLFRVRKVRPTAEFVLEVGGATQRSRATFTLLRRV